MENIRKIARTNPDKVKTMLQQMQGNLSAMASKIVHTGTTNKYTSINTKDGYIEFRSPGGDWLGEYAADPDKIKNTLLRFTVALDIAMKPELYRQEYMKKLYKTLSLGESDDTIQFFARYAAGELPQSALKSFVKQAQQQRKMKKLSPDQGPSDSDSTATPLDYPAATSNTPGSWAIMNQATRNMLQGLGGTFIYASQAAAEIALSNNIRRADIRIINTDNGQVYDIDGRPARYNTGTQSQTSSRDQEFTGTWEVVSRSTDEVVHTISGIGNAVQDAERYAQRWQEQTGFDDPVYVRPQMQPRSTGGGGFARAPHTSIYQVIDNRDGQVILGGATRTFAYTVEMTNIYIRTPRYNLTPEDIRIIDLNTNTAYKIDGSPANASAPATQSEQLFNVRWTDDYGHPHDINTRAPNANAAMDRVRAGLAERGLGVRSIEANPVGRAGGEPNSGANYEIVDRSSGSDRVVFRFIANTAQEAIAKLSDWVQGTGEYQPGDSSWRNRYALRPIEGRPTAQPVPGSTQDRINQRLTGQQDQARGTESLPPGNTRWLVLDSNDREVYSFVHRSNQGEANVYAANWLRHQGLLGSGEFMVVPAR